MDGGPHTVLRVGDNVYWRRVHCLIKYKYTGGTRTMTSHLEKRHGKKDPRIAGKEIVGQRIELAFARSVLNPYKRRKVFTNGSDTFDPRIFEELLIEWVAVSSISFKSCESEQFKALLGYLNKHVNNYLPSRTTLRSWSVQQYDTRQKTLILELSSVT